MSVMFFDIGNVLLEPIHGKILDDIFENRNVNMLKEEFKKLSSEVLNKSFVGKISLDETWKELFNIAKISDAKTIEEIKNIKVKRNTTLLNYIEKDLTNNYEIGIISDLSQIGCWVVKNYYKDFLNVCDKDKIFISTSTKKTKRKDKEEYFRSIKQSAKDKSCIFIDDEISNIKSAKNSGFKAILYEANLKWEKANKKLIEDFSKLKRWE